jgi:pyruvate/2-oxoglutarate dehydrogenase complex dihydrolipoamide acyltransferase (E2) component
MTIDIIVPPLSQTSDTLVLTAWLKKVGERVTKGEALFEVETDKATLEVESPATGTLSEVLAQPGAEIAVKTRIGSIALGETPTAASAPPPTPRPQPAERILASPRARRLADTEGLALQGIPASGPRGMIVERDVRARLAEAKAAVRPPSAPAQPALVEPASPPAPAEPQRVPLSATRRTIARRLQANQQVTIPVTLTRDVDATELVALRERLLRDLAGQDVRPTYTDFLASIVARCLQRHPSFNATFDGEQLELHEAVHLALAVDTERGLLAPVLRDVERQGLVSLARQRGALVQRALAGALTPEDMAGGTFTLTNLGSLGIDAFTPLLNPPQIAILGLGRIRAVAGPIGDTIGLRQAMFLSLTFDHRAVDGAPAARLLGDIAGLVEQPERVWL